MCNYIIEETSFLIETKLVSAINAKQLQITFNKAVDASTVVESADSTLKDGVFSITAADSIANVVGNANSFKASLSADGKTLTVNADTYFSGNYAVTVNKDLIYIADGTKTVGAFSAFVKASDTTRPAITSVSYNDIAHAVIHFSEPVQDVAGANVLVNIARADGVALTTALTKANVTQGTDKSTYIVDLSGLNAADRNQNLTVTLTGVQDAVGNLLTPNPAVATVKYDISNTAKPAVSSVKVTGNTSFDVKFSSALSATPTVTVGVSSATATVDAKDSTLYHFTLGAGVTDLQTVSITGIVGLNFVSGDNFSQLVNFNASAAPTITSTAVQKINGVEYLVVTYNKNVTAGAVATATGTYFNPTTSITNPSYSFALTGNVSNLLAYGATASNQLKYDLSGLAAGNYTATLPAGFATDSYGVSSLASSTISFTRTSNTSSTAPTATVSKVVGNNNKVNVHFDKNVDAASALNITNYTIEGATVTGAVLTTNGSGSADVQLTVTNNTYSGYHQVNISGVKSADGVLMNVFSAPVTLTEDIAPTVTKAQITDTTHITLTFSKAVVNAAGATDTTIRINWTPIKNAQYLK
ncbi:hypothetical protein [Neobacillus sp. PS3-40]|uniref:hypothetical protein n=1 Tax=Neobacillus sp. PS3-40 TaxID=3070679 RepID=UPI0027E170D0|nr:hypothetical protein [Neobacillus sp. PS3-40]WML46145.1 hypothetical protein RCG20_09750 [Neobacillus sp. PS3-40]